MIGRDETPSTQTDGLIDIASDTSNEMNLVGAYYSPDYAKAVERSNEYVGLRLNYKWDREPALNVFFRSDQYPFVRVLSASVRSSRFLLRQDPPNRRSPDFQPLGDLRFSDSCEK